MSTVSSYRSRDAHTGAVRCAGCVSAGVENVRLSRALEAQRELTYKHAETADQLKDERDELLVRVDELRAEVDELKGKQ